MNNEKIYELLNGRLYMMSSPLPIHQTVSTKIVSQLDRFLEGKTCEVTHDLNVRLNDDEDTVCIPDIIVYCDNSKMGKHAYEEVPDFIIEIASPSNAYRDYLEKYRDYRRAGVKEYWIIDPENKIIFVNLLTDKDYTLYRYAFDDPVPVSILQGCVTDLSRFR